MDTWKIGRKAAVFCFICFTLISVSEEEPSVIPRRTTRPTTNTLSPAEPSEKDAALSLLEEKPQILMSIHAFKVELEGGFQFGIIWEKEALEATFGKPLGGRYITSPVNPAELEVETLVVPHPEKMMDYLSRFGKTSLIYSQSWSQPIGEQVTRENRSILPYITRFGDEKSESDGQPYSQSSVKVGMKVNVILNGLQISGEDPSADITCEIEMKDAYKTRDGLLAVNSIITADSTSVPLSHTLIQTNLFHHDDVRNEYVFLLTLRKVK